jgi:hypothetical protein
MSTADKILYFTLKNGWIILGAAFLLVYASIFMEMGNEDVILKWRAQPQFELWKKALLVITGLPTLGILWFRFRNSGT